MSLSFSRGGGWYFIKRTQFKTIIWIFCLLIVFVSMLSACEPKIHEAVGQVVNDKENVKRLTKHEDESVYGVYHLIDDDRDEIIQLVKQKGFVDEIDLMVIIDYKEDIIKEIKVLEHKESKDYGGLLTEDWFLERFKDKPIATLLELVKMSAKEENQIVAITGATITSEAVVKGVNLCMNNYHRMKED